MSQQLPFDFAYEKAQGTGDFIISASNETAVKWLGAEWLAPGLLLTGAPGSGKTHLSKVWQQQTNAVYIDNAAALGEVLHDNQSACLVIDEADRLAASHPEDVFHLYNRAAGNGTKILFCAALPLAAWKIGLPDLRSRLAALPEAHLLPPDDHLLLSLFASQLAQRGIMLKDDLLDYAMPRLPRGADDVIRLAAALDQFALEGGKRLNMALLREFFTAAHG